MKSLKSLMRRFFASKWRNAIWGGMSVIIGIVVGPVLERGFPDLFTEPNLVYLAFFVTVLVFVSTTPLILSMWRDTNQQIENANQYFKIVSDAIGQKARLVSARDGYREIKKWFENAESEILILSNYIFDWENGKPIFDKETLQSPERKALYVVLQKKVEEKKQSRKPFKFCRIVQIPKGHNLREIFPYDEYYYETSQYIVDVSRTNPEVASLRTVEPLFTNTFVIIDRKYLYIEFNAYTPDITNAFTPFVLVIDDPKSEVISSMLNLYQRIEAVSVLVREVS